MIQFFLSPLLATPVFSYIRYAMKWSPGRRVTKAIIVACAAYFLPFVIAAIVQGTSVIDDIVASLILIGSGWTLLLSTGYFVLNDVAGKTSPTITAHHLEGSMRMIDTEARPHYRTLTTLKLTQSSGARVRRDGHEASSV